MQGECKPPLWKWSRAGDVNPSYSSASHCLAGSGDCLDFGVKSSVLQSFQVFIVVFSNVQFRQKNICMGRLRILRECDENISRVLS